MYKYMQLYLNSNYQYKYEIYIFANLYKKTLIYYNCLYKKTFLGQDKIMIDLQICYIEMFT